MFCLGIPVYDTYSWAITRKPDNHSEGSAYADGFSVLADVAILRTLLQTAICLFWEEELPDGCLGLERRVPRSRRLKAWPWGRCGGGGGLAGCFRS